MTTHPTDHSSRTVVVGAGVIGIACAHYLADAGLDVTVIDRGTAAGACSHGNCGYICPSHVLPLTEPGAVRTALKSLFQPDAPFRVKPRLSPALWNFLFQFARRCNRRQMLAAGRHLAAILDSSMLEYRRLIPELPLDCEWRSDGLLYVLKTAHGMAEFAETDRMLTDEFGVKATRLEAADLSTFEPSLLPGLAGAYHYPRDASLRPDRLNAAWIEHLKTRGVRFVENCQLQGIERIAGRVARLQTSAGPMGVDRVVIATGAWSSQLASMMGCRIPIEPGKGYSVTMHRPDPCPRYPMLFPEHRVGMSPFEKGYRLGSMMEFAGFDTSIPARRIQQLRDAATHYLVAPHTSGPQETWYGWRPMTWDSLPIIGRVPGLGNAYLATGHNMLGMSLAPATGRLVAEMVLERARHLDVTAFSPDRFK